ncbi:VPLPA-CTERM sorting domain-containing protein [Primorskyibacter sp. S187A]|uniref:VPLPA-CTERM sorting domain-containing protein n=1 Tax=Primorskyibacter sp. S187A TaxID=3415130 RepID=UPI003C7D2165
MKLPIVLSVALGLAAGGAHAGIIDFEGVTPTDFGDPIDVGDFRFDFTASGWLIGDLDDGLTPGEVGNGTNVLYASGGSPVSVTMTRIDGGAFDVSALSAAESTGGTADILNVSGAFALGGSIMDDLAVTNAHQNFTLSGFVGLSSLTFSTATSGAFGEVGFELDNINTMAVTAPVPLPAGGMLLLTGLGAVALTRRKSKA